MKNSTKAYYIGVLLFFCVSVVSAQQTTQIHEDDVPLSIQGYFYSTYKNASETEWRATDHLGEKSLTASFVMDGMDKEVAYDMSGNLIEEVSIYKKTKSEYLLKSKINQKYPDSKLLAIKKVTKYNLNGTMQPKSYFEVSAKNGKNIVYVFFDEDKQLMKTDNVFNVAVN